MFCHDRWPSVLAAFLLIGSLNAGARGTEGSPPSQGVPRLVKFAGVLKDAQGKPRSGLVSVTFSIYAEPQGGEPLWSETQEVAAASDGRYDVLLGSATSGGLPEGLFSDSGAGDSARAGGRWLGIQVGQEAEQAPRVMLVSVPYALKATDAEKLAGRSVSEFVLAEQLKARLTQLGLFNPCESGGKNSASGRTSNPTYVRTPTGQQGAATIAAATGTLSGDVLEFTYTFFDPSNDLPASLDIPSIYVDRAYAFTITEVYCEINGSSASINLQKNGSNILSSNLACSTSGATSTDFVSGENSIAVGDKIGHVTVRAGRGLRRMNVVVRYTVR